MFPTKPSRFALKAAALVAGALASIGAASSAEAHGGYGGYGYGGVVVARPLFVSPSVVGYGPNYRFVRPNIYYGSVSRYHAYHGGFGYYGPRGSLSVGW